MSDGIAQYAPFILENIQKLKNQKVLIIGDVGLDEYVLGQVRRISPEAPVPVVEVDQEESRLGLASNVAQNISGLGGVPILVSVVGQDITAEQLRGLLRRSGVSPEYLVTDASRPTTRKLRVMVQNHHIVRVDYEHKQFLSEELEREVLQKVRATIDQAAAVIIQDYAKGVVSESLVQKIVKIAHEKQKKVLADPHRTTPVSYYRGVDLMTPNRDESLALVNEGQDELRTDVDLINRTGRKLMEAVGSKNMVITLAKEGMRLFENGKVIQLPTYARQVFDVTGAGDTVIAALALAWGSGFSLEQSCALANFAAGVVVGKVGCVPCTVDELIHYIQHRT